MSSLRKDTYCGLYCGACEIVNAKTEEQQNRVIQAFESSIPGWHASLDQMHCSGCKTEDVFVNCAKCPIRPCARARGIEFCHQCSDYPCQMHTFIQAAATQVPILRHVKAIARNQAYIREHGLNAWLQDQEEKWSCPHCGSPFSWYADSCHQCGQDLKGIKDYEARDK